MCQLPAGTTKQWSQKFQKPYNYIKRLSRCQRGRLTGIYCQLSRAVYCVDSNGWYTFLLSSEWFLHECVHYRQCISLINHQLSVFFSRQHYKADSLHGKKNKLGNIKLSTQKQALPARTTQQHEHKTLALSQKSGRALIILQRSPCNYLFKLKINYSEPDPNALIGLLRGSSVVEHV